MAKTKRIFEVLADTDSDGPACDGTVIFRFWKQVDADAFAAKSTCYGREAKVTPREATRQQLDRWVIS